MASAPKKSSAVMVQRDRKTTKLPLMQLGSFPKLFEPDEYEGKKKFKARLHLTPAAISDLEKVLQAKCIDAHFPALKEAVDTVTAEAKEQRKTPPVAICESKDDCQPPKEWIEDKLKEPHEKDKVQLPTIQLAVDAYKPLRKGQSEEDREMREIVFWDATGKIIENPKQVLRQMTSGTWLKPVVHTNLFLSKQLGKAPRCQLMLVGFQIIKLEKWGSHAPENQSAADEDEMRRIMGSEYDPTDDLAANLGGGDDDLQAPDDDEDSPF